MDILTAVREKMEKKLRFGLTINLSKVIRLVSLLISAQESLRKTGM